MLSNNRPTYLYNSPTGILKLGFSNETVVMMDWIVNRKHFQVLKRVEPILTDPTAVLYNEVISQLDGYFAGELKLLTFPIVMTGSDFEKKVWTALTEIPYGHKVTYGDVASSIGREDAVRAVAGAIGRNPLNIIVPCHRVVGAGNRLVGYAGGLETKKFLLRLERDKSYLNSSIF